MRAGAVLLIAWAESVRRGLDVGKCIWIQERAHHALRHGVPEELVLRLTFRLAKRLVHVGVNADRDVQRKHH